MGGIAGAPARGSCVRQASGWVLGARRWVGRIVAPKDVHVLILGACEYVTLHGRRDFADRIKVRILRREDYPGLSRWVDCNHRGP